MVVHRTRAYEVKVRAVFFYQNSSDDVPRLCVAAAAQQHSFIYSINNKIITYLNVATRARAYTFSILFLVDFSFFLISIWVMHDERERERGMRASNSSPEKSVRWGGDGMVFFFWFTHSVQYEWKIYTNGWNILFIWKARRNPRDASMT